VNHLKILLVDDDASFAQQTAEALRGEGHRVWVSTSGASAIELAPELRPDVVLLEIDLRDASGYEVARALRKNVPPTTPIIAVTGLRQATLAEELDLLLNKPIPCELFGGLLEYMRRRRQQIVENRKTR